MDCQKEELKTLLPEYCSGNVTGRERAEIEKHLSQCASCRESVRLISLLVGHPGEKSAQREGEPLTTEQIIQYYTDSSLLDESTRQTIELHLKSSPEQAFNLEFLRECESGLRRLVAPADVRHQPARTGLGEWLSSLIRKPALAYLLLLLTLYPATRWVIDQVTQDVGKTPTLVTERPTVLRETTRSSENPVVVPRSAPEALVALDLPYYHVADHYIYHVSVTPEEGKTPVKARSYLNFADAGHIRVLLNTSPLHDGVYILTVQERDPAEKIVVNVAYYSFELVTGP
jgi:hypothetical protein